MLIKSGRRNDETAVNKYRQEVKTAGPHSVTFQCPPFFYILVTHVQRIVSNYRFSYYNICCKRTKKKVIYYYTFLY